jgi:hypothetical protein
VFPGLAHRSVRCATGQCLVHQGPCTPNSSASGFQAQLCYNSPDCPVHQRSNGYLRATVDSNGWIVQHSNAAEVRAEGQRGTGLFGVAPDCPVPHRIVRCRMRTKPPTVDQLQALTTGWRGGAPDTVRCAHRQQPSPMATIWLVAINTNPTGHFKEWESKQHSKSYSW